MKVLSFPPPTDDLTWTGERFLVGLTGEIEFEHYHRYLFATQFCRGRDVLDIASGEGYGSFVLSQVAKHVTGVDIDVASVEHAERAYGSDLLTFVEGACSKIPLSDKSIDVVISFETIEHIQDQSGFLYEVCRVLRDGGLFVVSTPDRDVYADPSAPNPFHMLELSEFEFSQLLSQHFRHIRIGLQKATSGSVILPSNAVAADTEIFCRSGTSTFEASGTLKGAPFIIAIASNSAVPAVRWGILDDQLYLPALHEQCANEQRARQKVERRLTAELADRVRQLETCEQQLAAAAADHQHQIASRDRKLEVATAERQRLEEKLGAVEFRLNAIETSTSWRLMTTLHRMIRGLGIRRRRDNV